MIIRSLTNRVEALESSMANQQELWRKEREITNAGYLDVQKKLDFIEYKAFSNEKDLKQLNQMQPFREIEPNDSNKAFTQN